MRVIDRSDRNPPITATSMTFTPSLRHAKRAVIGEFRSDLSITCMIDGNFGNVSAGVLFSKVAYQGKQHTLTRRLIEARLHLRWSMLNRKS